MTSESAPRGQAYAYSGSAYATLGPVLEGVTGRSYRDLLVSRLFGPLGMARTVPGLDAAGRAATGAGPDAGTPYGRVARELAIPYRLFGHAEMVRSLPPPPELDAAANVISTVLDYARFVHALLEGALLADSTRVAMWTAYVTPAGRRLPYGLGWFVQQYEAERLVWHHGYWPESYSSLVLILPRTGAIFVAMANADGLSAPFYSTEGVEGNPLACAFLRIALRPTLPCAEAAEAAIHRWEAGRVPVSLPDLVVADSLLRRYAGPCRTPSGRVLQIRHRGERLWWETGAGQRFELFPVAPDRFVLKAADYTLHFVRAASGSVERLDITTGGTTVPLPREPGGEDAPRQ